MGGVNVANQEGRRTCWLISGIAAPAVALVHVSAPPSGRLRPHILGAMAWRERKLIKDAGSRHSFSKKSKENHVICFGKRRLVFTADVEDGMVGSCTS